MAIAWRVETTEGEDQLDVLLTSSKAPVDALTSAGYPVRAATLMEKLLPAIVLVALVGIVIVTEKCRAFGSEFRQEIRRQLRGTSTISYEAGDDFASAHRAGFCVVRY